MKKLYTILAAVLVTASTFAQAPEKMSYQAVVRNSSDILVTNQAVGMQISILQTTPMGTAVYVETHTPTTNVNGLVTLEIGTGNVVSGDFTTIDWSTDSYFIKTETDPNGGISYTITGTSQLLSVPYALHAKTAENVIGFSGDLGNAYSDYLYWDTISNSWRVGGDKVHIGQDAGSINQAPFTVAIGERSGYDSQGFSAVAIGESSGEFNQQDSAVAIGSRSGSDSQGFEAVAIGSRSGEVQQGFLAIAIGSRSGNSNQAPFAVAIGERSGEVNQAPLAVAIGESSGRDGQAPEAVAIGSRSGSDSQGIFAVAIGSRSGSDFQGSEAVAIGSRSGSDFQGSEAVAIGSRSGEVNQGNNAIAIGANSGTTNQNNNSIILNATGLPLESTVPNSLYIAPIRDANGPQVLKYDPTTKEVTATDTTKMNYSATVAPSVTDDVISNFSVGSMWIDTVGLQAYICIDSSPAAAIWKQITQ
ncbi:MAG: hypothetical protein V7719_18710 [Psychroserpens sp.]|uniref:hypothetical protein n=1 Tax=Psychroserpens sp. TaxID=2020870 RepID=UPI003002729A